MINFFLPKIEGFIEYYHKNEHWYSINYLEYISIKNHFQSIMVLRCSSNQVSNLNYSNMVFIQEYYQHSNYLMTLNWMYI